MPPLTPATRLDVLPRPTGDHADRSALDRRRRRHASRDLRRRRAGTSESSCCGSGTRRREDAGGRRAELIPAPWTPIADQLGLDTDGVLTHAIADVPVADTAGP